MIFMDARFLEFVVSCLITKTEFRKMDVPLLMLKNGEEHTEMGLTVRSTS
jgi:hypothetical protein